jgi:hypothetical protein
MGQRDAGPSSQGHQGGQMEDGEAGMTKLRNVVFIIGSFPYGNCMNALVPEAVWMRNLEAFAELVAVNRMP